MSMPRITLLSADCTIHSLARPRLLARMLAHRFEVEVVAPVFPGDQDAYASSNWPGPYVPVPVRPFPEFARSARRLIDALTGDVVYALKPRATSLGIALLARRQRRLPVVVDLDDREIYHCYPYSHHLAKNLLLSFKEWRHPNAYPLTLAMDHLVRKADYVTSVSSYFQRLFGGSVIPQAVDTELFDPTRYDRERLRSEWGLDGNRVVLFMGRPLPHKGLDEIVRAVGMSRHPEVRLVVVGGWTPYVERLREMERVVFLGPQPFEKCPAFLAMADAVMLPQRASPISLGQMPTKLPEAMAMGVPVITTAISDIAEQVGDCGIVVQPGDVGSLARALDRVLGDEDLARKMGVAARQRIERLYSTKAVRPALERVFERYV
ncbi:MAG: glycosyltransferase family 4 protein [Sphingomonadaceae bacterium]